MKNKKFNSLQSLGGLVYSTNPEAMKEVPQDNETPIEHAEQYLKVSIDKKKRAGKIVTLVEGFEGSEDDLKALGKQLKTKCGVGGSAKDGLIIIQGNFKEKIKTWLYEMGYTKVK